MKHIALSLLSCSLFFACQPAVDPADQLVGTWTQTSPGVVDTQTLTLRYTFSALSGGEGVYRVSFAVSDGDTKCVTTSSATGTWSATATSLTRAVSADGEASKTGCTDAAMNYAAKPEPKSEQAIYGILWAGTYNWSLSGNDLTFTEPGKTETKVFKRGN